MAPVLFDLDTPLDAEAPQPSPDSTIPLFDLDTPLGPTPRRGGVGAYGTPVENRSGSVHEWAIRRGQQLALTAAKARGIPLEQIPQDEIKQFAAGEVAQLLKRKRDAFVAANGQGPGISVDPLDTADDLTLDNVGRQVVGLGTTGKGDKGIAGAALESFARAGAMPLLAVEPLVRGVMGPMNSISAAKRSLDQYAAGTNETHGAGEITASIAGGLLPGMVNPVALAQTAPRLGAAAMPVMAGMASLGSEVADVGLDNLGNLSADELTKMGLRAVVEGGTTYLGRGFEPIVNKLPSTAGGAIRSAAGEGAEGALAGLGQTGLTTGAQFEDLAPAAAIGGAAEAAGAVTVGPLVNAITAGRNAAQPGVPPTPAPLPPPTVLDPALLPSGPVPARRGADPLPPPDLAVGPVPARRGATPQAPSAPLTQDEINRMLEELGVTLGAGLPPIETGPPPTADPGPTGPVELPDPPLPAPAIPTLADDRALEIQAEQDRQAVAAKAEQDRQAAKDAEIQAELDRQAQYQQHKDDVAAEEARLRAAEDVTTKAEAARVAQAQAQAETDAKAAEAAKAAAKAQKDNEIAAQKAIEAKRKADEQAANAAAQAKAADERKAQREAERADREAKAAKAADEADALEEARRAQRRADLKKQAEEDFTASETRKAEAHKAKLAREAELAAARAASKPAPKAPATPAPPVTPAAPPVENTLPPDATAGIPEDDGPDEAPLTDAEADAIVNAPPDARPAVRAANPLDTDARLRSKLFRSRVRETVTSNPNAPRVNQFQVPRHFSVNEQQRAQKLGEIVKAFGRPPLLPAQFPLDPATGKLQGLPPPHPFFTFQDVQRRLSPEAMVEIGKLTRTGLTQTQALEKLGWTKDHNTAGRVGQSIDRAQDDVVKWGVPIMTDPGLAELEAAAKRNPPARPNKAIKKLNQPPPQAPPPAAGPPPVPTGPPPAPVAPPASLTSPSTTGKPEQQSLVPPPEAAAPSTTGKPVQQSILPPVPLPPPPVPAESKAPERDTGVPALKQKILSLLGQERDIDAEFQAKRDREIQRLMDTVYGIVPNEQELLDLSTMETVGELDAAATAILADAKTGKVADRAASEQAAAARDAARVQPRDPRGQSVYPARRLLELGIRQPTPAVPKSPSKLRDLIKRVLKDTLSGMETPALAVQGERTKTGELTERGAAPMGMTNGLMWIDHTAVLPAAQADEIAAGVPAVAAKPGVGNAVERVRSSVNADAETYEAVPFTTAVGTDMIAIGDSTGEFLTLREDLWSVVQAAAQAHGGTVKIAQLGGSKKVLAAIGPKGDVLAFAMPVELERTNEALPAAAYDAAREKPPVTPGEADPALSAQMSDPARHFDISTSVKPLGSGAEVTLTLTPKIPGVKPLSLTYQSGSNVKMAADEAAWHVQHFQREGRLAPELVVVGQGTKLSPRGVQLAKYLNNYRLAFDKTAPGDRNGLTPIAMFKHNGSEDKITSALGYDNATVRYNKIAPVELTAYDLVRLEEAPDTDLHPADRALREQALEAGVDLRLVNAPPGFYGAHTAPGGIHTVYVSARSEPGHLARVLGHELTHAGLYELPPAERGRVLNAIRSAMTPESYAEAVANLNSIYNTEGWTDQDFMEEIASQYGEKVYDPAGQVFHKLYQSQPNVVQQIIDKLMNFVDKLGLRGKDRRLNQIVRGVHARAMAVMREQSSAHFGGRSFAPPLVGRSLSSVFEYVNRQIANADGALSVVQKSALSRRLHAKYVRPWQDLASGITNRIEKRRIARINAEIEAGTRTGPVPESWDYNADDIVDIELLKAHQLAEDKIEEGEEIARVHFMLVGSSPLPLPPKASDITTKALQRRSQGVINKLMGKSKFLSKWLFRKGYVNYRNAESIARDNPESRPVFTAGTTRRAQHAAINRVMAEQADTVFKSAGTKELARAQEILHKFDQNEKPLTPADYAGEGALTQEIIKQFQDTLTETFKMKAGAWQLKLGVPKLGPDPLDSTPYQAAIDQYDTDLENALNMLKAARAAHAKAKTPASKAAVAMALSDYKALTNQRAAFQAMRALVHIQTIMGESARDGYVPHYWTGDLVSLNVVNPMTGDVLERRMPGSQAEIESISEELADKYPGMEIHEHEAGNGTELPMARGLFGSARSKLKSLMAEDPAIAVAMFGDSPQGKLDAADFLSKVIPTGRQEVKGYEKNIAHVLSRSINGTATFVSNTKFDSEVKPIFKSWDRAGNSQALRDEKDALKAEAEAIEAMRHLGALSPIEAQHQLEAIGLRERVLDASYSNKTGLLAYWTKWADLEKNGDSTVGAAVANTVNMATGNIMLGFNYVTSMFNLTQNSMVGMPLAGAIGGGVGMREMVTTPSVLGQWLKGLHQVFTRTKNIELVYKYAKSRAAKEPSLAKALKDAADSASVFDVPTSNEFQSALRDPKFGSGGIEKAGAQWHSFERSEVVNRLGSFVGGFRMAEKLKGDPKFWDRAVAMGYDGHTDPAQFAAWFANQVNFHMGDINRPMGLRGGMKVLTSLKSYGLNVNDLYLRMHDAAGDLPKAEGTRLKAAARLMIAQNMAVAGVIGGYLPAAIMRALIEQLMRAYKEDKTYDLDMELYRWLGEDSRIADLVTRGVPAALGVPVGSIPGRMSFFGGLVPDNPGSLNTLAAPFAAAGRVMDATMSAVDVFKKPGPFEGRDAVDMALGLAGVLSATSGVTSIVESGVLGGLDPSLATGRGQTTKAGRTITPVKDLNGTDIAMMAFGIRPEKVIDNQIKDRVITANENANKGITRAFAVQFADAIMRLEAGDKTAEARLKELGKTLEQHNIDNAAHPEKLVLPTLKDAIKREVQQRMLGGTHMKYVEKAARPALLEYEGEDEEVQAVEDEEPEQP